MDQFSQYLAQQGGGPSMPPIGGANAGGPGMIGGANAGVMPPTPGGPMGGPPLGPGGGGDIMQLLEQLVPLLLEMLQGGGGPPMPDPMGAGPVGPMGDPGMGAPPDGGLPPSTTKPPKKSEKKETK